MVAGRAAGTIAVWILGLAGLAGTAAAGGVRIVTPQGNLEFPDLQSAVDAAVDGDVLLVGAGTYAPFVVDGKGLSIFAAQQGQVSVQGGIELRNLPADASLVLSGIEVQGKNLHPIGEPGLRVTACAGLLRLESCSFKGGKGAQGSGSQANQASGGNGVAVSGSFQVSFRACTMTGGDGYGKAGIYTLLGLPGGNGLDVSNGSVALYDCTLRGGTGGSAGDTGGPGGHGCLAHTGGIFASGCSSTGGTGGFADDFIFSIGGSGGHGLRLESGTQAQLIENQWVGGFGGNSYLGFAGAGGQPISAAAGSVLVQHALEARTFEAQPISGDAGSVALEVSGVDGDRAFLLYAREPGWKVPVPTTGILLLNPPPKALYDPLGTLNGASAVFALQLPDLGTGQLARMLYLQGKVKDTAGASVLATPLSMLVLNRTSPPDCDGNGLNDYVDAVEGGIADCDANLVPDACDMAAGKDCNGNGQVDACDIAAGTSLDLNANGVPDECDPFQATWHVNAAAAAGGNGSAGHPFQTIGQGIAVALEGDMVLVHDGTYVGAGNRNLSFGGRDLRVRSQNGPTACVIDLQGSGRAFDIQNQESSAALIEGFTIRNGNALGGLGEKVNGGGMRVWSSDATVERCVFEGCQAKSHGGALYLFDSDSRVDGCVFRDNLIGNGAGGGGAISAVHQSPTIVGCRFEDNTSLNAGGALYLSGTGTLSHCVLLGNSAANFGGAIYGEGVPRIDNCLIAGNQSAYAGGGISGNGNALVTNTTIVGNVAQEQGGGIHRSWSSSLELIDSIVWGNAAPQGSQVALVAFVGSGCALFARHSDLQTGAGAFFVDPGCAVEADSGCLSADPQFIDPDGPDGDPLTFADNLYGLGPGSPCIDAGDNAEVAPDIADLDDDGDTGEPTPFDLARNPRFADDPLVPDTGSGSAPIVDMGAFEKP